VQIPVTGLIRGGTGVVPFNGTPANGTNAIQTLTFGGTGAAGDTFKLTLGSQTTAAIAWSATNATLIANIDAALEALGGIGTGGVTTAAGTMTAGIGTITVTFTGVNAAGVVPTMTVSALVTTASLTVACATTTPGVAASLRGASTGVVLNNTAAGVLYSQQGTTPPATTWTKVSGT
jgi:hypothetical protein